MKVWINNKCNLMEAKKFFHQHSALKQTEQLTEGRL